jgi:hypothetical protein
MGKSSLYKCQMQSKGLKRHKSFHYFFALLLRFPRLKQLLTMTVMYKFDLKSLVAMVYYG